MGTDERNKRKLFHGETTKRMDKETSGILICECYVIAMANVCMWDLYVQAEHLWQEVLGASELARKPGPGHQTAGT